MPEANLELDRPLVGRQAAEVEGPLGGARRQIAKAVRIGLRSLAYIHGHARGLNRARPARHAAGVPFVSERADRFESLEPRSVRVVPRERG